MTQTSAYSSLSPQRLLVIRLGALGDLVLCMKGFQAIRTAHPTAHIALLTMPGFAAFARQMPWFDEVIVDPRPATIDLKGWLNLRRQVQAFAPTMVYDLQGKTRQTLLYLLLGGPLWGPVWSGAAPGCSHPRPWPPRQGAHFCDFIDDQLQAAGVAEAGLPNLDWLDVPVTMLRAKFDLPARYVVLIPGCSPDRLYKRWPASCYAELAKRLAAQGYSAVMIGGAADREALDAIARANPAVRNLGGQTSLADVAALARQAAAIVGNDTGPTHLAAAAGGRTLTLFSGQVNPIWSAPRGPYARFLQAEPIDRLSLDEVLTSLPLDQEKDFATS